MGWRQRVVDFHSDLYPMWSYRHYEANERGGDGVKCECIDLMVRHLFEPRRLLLECDECGYKDIVFIHAEVTA